ncbi:unnamed protein product [Strongylus vulgaris]|uniref:Uncharacterized protein n=1 Tax=Strongylus vulgaris TaxID=40348 RepID=A0A3P7J813_STRVU|nr:unnamed protein product [Strongylus vulgaris]
MVGDVIDEIQEQYEEHPEEVSVVYTDNGEGEMHQQDQENENVVVDGVEYAYEVETGENIEVISDLNIERPGSPHVLVDDIPTADREEIVVTDDMN